MNEVDLEGNEALLSDFSMPQPPDEVEDNENCEADLKELLGEDKVQLINELIESKLEESKCVSLDVTDYDKDKRSKLHKLLRTVYGKKLVNNTESKDDKKFINVKKPTNRDRRRDYGWRWPHEFTCFILHKENIDTLQAIATLARKLDTKPSHFAYAGTKDKRAKTSQWISVKKIEPQKICQAARQCQGLRVGNFKFLPDTLRLGSLKGNRFRIALRSVKGEQDEIEKSLESLRDVGFINYYGLQRFGNCRKIPTYMIGKALLASDFKKACDLILEERDGEPSYMQTMRKCYTETKDPKKASECLHSTNTCVEARILLGLVKHGSTNYLQALLNLPRNMLMLYLHAYQSFVFNRVASKRCEMGLSVKVGDLVFTEDPGTEVIDEVDDEAEDNEKAPEQEVESRFQAMARPLTEEDLTIGSFTIYDIILPLPGYDIKYPTNELGTTYQELLAQDDLTSEKLKNKHPSVVFCVYSSSTNFSILSEFCR